MNKKVFYNSIFIISLTCLLLISFCSCSTNNMKSYYTEKENYITVSGTITHLQYSEDASALYLGFEDLSVALDDNSFKIVGNNLQIVQSKGIDSKLHIGDRVSFITAPKYFGDGYVMPIVAITANEETMLEFETGYTNFLSWLS